MMLLTVSQSLLSTLQGEIIAGLILIVPALATAVYAALQTYVNAQRIKTRPTHDEVSAQINTAVNNALASNGTTDTGVAK